MSRFTGLYWQDQKEPVNRANRYTGENARTCTRRADVSPQTSIWRVCVSPAIVVACNYSIISAQVCNTAVHRRQQFSYDSSALSAQAGVHSIGTVPKTWNAYHCSSPDPLCDNTNHSMGHTNSSSLVAPLLYAVQQRLLLYFSTWPWYCYTAVLLLQKTLL